MDLTEENAADQVGRFIREQLPSLEYPETRFDGRGIVIATGGFKFHVNAWASINMLRRLGCQLPVECWHLGPPEHDEDWARLVEPLGAVCVDALAVRDSRPDSWSYRHQQLHGWELKPYALTHSRFREALFLDADNMPVRDPTLLFETPQFREHGAIFWPDYGRLNRNRRAWKVFGDIPYRDEPEVESGQIVVDKRRCWRCLMLCHWYMQNSNNFFFNYVHGDKEVFHLAWRKLDQSYAMPVHGIRGLPGVMCQHDFQGRRLFQHRNMRKWRLSDNPATPGFLFEKECCEDLAHLRRTWRPAASQVHTLSEEDRAAMEKAGGAYRYRRVGFDERTMDLEASGLVGQGGRGVRDVLARQAGAIGAFGRRRRRDRHPRPSRRRDLVRALAAP